MRRLSVIAERFTDKGGGTLITVLEVPGTTAFPHLGPEVTEFALPTARVRIVHHISAAGLPGDHEPVLFTLVSTRSVKRCIALTTSETTFCVEMMCPAISLVACTLPSASLRISLARLSVRPARFDSIRS